MLHQDLGSIEAIQKFVPPFWVSLGARSLAEGRAWPALLGTAGCFTIGALGLHRAYRSTLKFYHGETGGKAAVANPRASSKERDGIRQTGNLLELRLPGVPEEAGAVALASFRSMLRAPEVKMAWAMSFFITVIVGGSLLLRSPSTIPEILKPLVALGATAFSFLALFQLLGNQFGFDRDGFGTFVLSPTNR
jgi:hypothetical protein